MSQKNPHLASQRKHALGLGKMIIVFVCFALPVVFYLVTGHPASIVVFLCGMTGIGVHIVRVSSQ